MKSKAMVKLERVYIRSLQQLLDHASAQMTKSYTYVPRNVEEDLKSHLYYLGLELYVYISAS